MLLTEIIKVDDNEELDKLCKIIESHCGEILAIYRKTKGKFLYRGIKNFYKLSDGKNFLFKKIRDDRKPIELSGAMQKIHDDSIRKLGGKAGRGNSIFCSTDEDEAYNWGNSTIIFPKDGWNITYFSKIKLRGGDYIFDFLDSLHNEVENIMSMEFSKTTYQQAIEKKNLKPFIFDEAFSGKVYTIKMKEAGNKMVCSNLDEIIMEEFKRLGISFDKNSSKLLEQFKRRSEILISGDSYLAISISKSDDTLTYIRKRLNF